jgi:hypothetical protein
MTDENTAPPPLFLPALVQSYEIWSLESSWFLFYGFFMLVVALAAGQAPLVGLPLSLALDGPLVGGLVLATRRIQQGERPGIEDFMGGFRRALPLAALSLIVAAITLAGLLLLLLPGLLAAALLGVATPVMLLESRGLRDSLEASARLVRPRLWPVATLMLLLAAVQGLLALPALGVLLRGEEPGLAQALPLFLGLGLLGPFHGILCAVLYQRLSSVQDL